MTHLAMLADELQQLAGIVRAAADDVSVASRQASAAPVEAIGPAMVGAAVVELQDESTRGLDRIAAAGYELDDALRRLSDRSSTLAEGS